MKSSTASRIVIMSALGVFGIGWYKSAKAGHPLPSTRMLIGGTVTFTLLSFLADFEPEIAGPIALAILTTDIFANGTDILAYVNGQKGKDGSSVNEAPPPHTSGTAPKKKAGKSKVAHPKPDVGQVPGL